MDGERSEREGERTASDPVGTMLGLSFGPFGAALGGVVDRDRFAFKVAFGTGAERDREDGLDGATTVEIEDAGRTATDSTEDGESTGDAD